MEIKIITILMIVVFTVSFFVSTAAASQHAEQRITVHYHRPDGDYGGWKLWSWSVPEGINAEIDQAGMSEFGAVFTLDADKYKNAGSIGVLPKYNQWEQKDDPNRFIDLSQLKTLHKKELFIVSGKKEVFTSRPDISPFVKNAFLDSDNEITVVLSKKISASAAAGLKTMVRALNVRKNYALSRIALIDENGLEIADESAGRGHSGREKNRRPDPHHGDKHAAVQKSNLLKIVLEDGIKYDFSEAPPEAEVAIDGFLPARLKVRGVLYSSAFRYDGELGCAYTPAACAFRVFAPAASAVSVQIYDQHTGSPSAEREMKKERAGVWTCEIAGNLLNKYYKYKVTIGGETHLALDPYSKCNTAHNGRAMIIDDKTHVADSPVFTIDEAVIYEMHIRDFTIDEKTTAAHRGKFLGAAEENTHHAGNPAVNTGIAHLKELGINTVQILPFQDFENDESSPDYNWGYMPVNFNSPDGWYATKTYDSSRVAECKKMIDAFHRNGIKVVMDVVYNHTAEGNELVKHSFNALAPNYYYRCKLNGDYWNGSGCGNEFKSESYMGRKFIIDSLKYWVKEYKIDGFRFDLMGLIDTETVYLLTDELKKIKPDIFIYGEPWAAGAAGIEPTVKGAQRDKGFAVFNDIFRDAIKGSVWDNKGGYVQGTKGVELIERGVIGSILDFASSPLESINYCEAHDNRTLYDTLIHTTGYDKSITLEKIKKMHKLACLLALTSQGVPFLHAGQEMMRTKGGEENSYNKPDSINKISWDLKIENRDMVEFVKELISLRKAHPMLRMKTADEIFECVKFFTHDLKLPVAPRCLAYM
ncbi:MAG TPA: type I pullulanase, partial [Candidatus Wallbacteria bacterium]|nr:type I pullulanase [Candidatus Wallbacteria bacterium]